MTSLGVDGLWHRNPLWQSTGWTKVTRNIGVSLGTIVGLPYTYTPWKKGKMGEPDGWLFSHWLYCTVTHTHTQTSLLFVSICSWFLFAFFFFFWFRLKKKKIGTKGLQEFLSSALGVVQLFDMQSTDQETSRQRKWNGKNIKMPHEITSSFSPFVHIVLSHCTLVKESVQRSSIYVCMFRVCVTQRPATCVAVFELSRA